MTTLAARGDLVVSIRVAAPERAAPRGDQLGPTPGRRGGDPREPADLILSRPDGAEGHFEQPLTPRERDVIALLAEGLSNREIGGRLGISPDTAKFHVGRVIDKLDATGRTDAVAHAARLGIIRL